MVYKRDILNHKLIESKKKLYFFKMHDFEVFQTFQGSKAMNYSMMPAKGAPTFNLKPEEPETNPLEKSELKLRKSAIPARPSYQSKR